MNFDSAINSAAAGMEAASAMLAVAGSNIANLYTPGYKSLQLNLASQPNGGGVAVPAVTTDPTAGPLGPNGQQESNVDLVTQIVALSKAKELYTANAIVLRTADRTLGTLLDVVAGR